MLTIKELEQENALGFVLNGEVKEAELDLLVAALDKKAEQYGKVRLYGEIVEIGGWKDFKTFLSNLRAKLSTFGKLEKYAIVTDKRWLENLEGIADFITPHMDVKTFETKEQEEALAWLKAPLKRDVPGSEMIALGFDNILGIRIFDRLTHADYQWFNQAMAEQVERFGKIHLFLEITDFEGISLNAIWDDLKTGIKYYRQIKKAAITGRSGWLKQAVKIGNFITPGVEMKYFAPKEKDQAIAWLQ